MHPSNYTNPPIPTPGKFPYFTPERVGKKTSHQAHFPTPTPNDQKHCNNTIILPKQYKYGIPTPYLPNTNLTPTIPPICRHHSRTHKCATLLPAGRRNSRRHETPKPTPHIIKPRSIKNSLLTFACERVTLNATTDHRLQTTNPPHVFQVTLRILPFRRSAVGY